MKNEIAMNSNQLKSETENEINIFCFITIMLFNHHDQVHIYYGCKWSLTFCLIVLCVCVLVFNRSSEIPKLIEFQMSVCICCIGARVIFVGCCSFHIYGICIHFMSHSPKLQPKISSERFIINNSASLLVCMLKNELTRK